MGSRRHLRVLPSNAPTLVDSDGIHRSPTRSLGLDKSLQTCSSFNNDIDCRVCGLQHACSTCLRADHGSHACKKGILRVSSGNVGSNGPVTSFSDSKEELHGHYTPKASTTLLRGPDHSAQVGLKLDHRKSRRGLDPRNKLPLYYRAELQSPRYNAYRVKNRGKALKDQKWPDDVEEAFQRALRRYPRQGRKKAPLNGKQSGGNEFITDYISKHTGVERNRKQVSSHIQVLKNFLGDNVAWMSLIHANGFGTDGEDETTQGQVKHEGATGRWTSISTNKFNYNHASKSSHLKALPPSPAETVGSNWSSSPTIRSVKFEMSASKEEGEALRALHTYTSIQSETASAPRLLDDVVDWRTFFPPLSAFHYHGQIDCPIFLFETHLNLTDSYPESGSSLSIDLSLGVAQGMAFTNWQSHTRFYEERGHLVDLEKLYEEYEQEKQRYYEEQGRQVHHESLKSPWRDLKCSPTKDTADCWLSDIPLKSLWWVGVFSKIIQRKQAAEATKDLDAIKREEEYAHQYLRGMSVMQEIWATPRGYDNEPDQRMAILLWKFGKARKGVVATTSWRRLDPPASPFQVQSPTPPTQQPPLTLDTTVHDAMIRRPAVPYGDYYNPQPSIFAENAEELLKETLSDGSSPATTPALDYGYASLPSSTSTSFPSEISNPGYHSHLTQESSFQSQDSAYPSLGSFDSQDSRYHLQEFDTHSQDVYDSQENVYHSQNMLYHQSSNQVYEWPSPQTALTDDAPVSHDFTGGKIHVSYTEHEAPISEYQAPLIAPRANIMPQHQLIQHPENFDHHDYLEPDLGSQHDHQRIDWEKAASQPLNAMDMGFHVDLEHEMVQQFEQLQEQAAELEGMEAQGLVLGEVQDGEESRLEEYQ